MVADYILWGKLPKARVRGIRNCCVVEGQGELLILIVGFCRGMEPESLYQQWLMILKKLEESGKATGR